MMLAGLPVADDAVDGLAELVRATGAADLADRLERAVPTASADCAHILLNEHQWRRGEGLDWD